MIVCIFFIKNDLLSCNVDLVGKHIKMFYNFSLPQPAVFDSKFFFKFNNYYTSHLKVLMLKLSV